MRLLFCAIRSLLSAIDTQFNISDRAMAVSFQVYFQFYSPSLGYACLKHEMAQLHSTRYAPVLSTLPRLAFRTFSTQLHK